MSFYESPLNMVSHLSESFRGVLVIRHSARYPILSDDQVFTAGLTAEGVQQAERLGMELKKVRRPGRLLSSPVARCLDTAAAIARGAGWEGEVKPDYRLSHPFIEPAWNALPVAWGKDPLPEPVAKLLDLVMAGEDIPGRLDICVTHDTIVAVLAGYFTGVHFDYPYYWPDFLEGVLLWQNGGNVHLRWRAYELTIGPWPIPNLRQLNLGF
jgi:hypothetical protein